VEDHTLARGSKESIMKITIVTDTWHNVNGVVTTLTNTVRILKKWGHEVQVIEPSQFRTVDVPVYPEVKFSWDLWRVGPMIEEFKPDAIHIATEGPLGLAARWYCKVDKRSIPHNTSYHTKIPEYLKQYYNIPIDYGYWTIRLFHKFSTRVLVTSPSMKQLLSEKDFHNLEVWNRGVDKEIFNSSLRRKSSSLTESSNKPVILCVSRASIEKGLDDFCQLKTEGTKIFVGDGPYLETLKAKYSDVIFTGYKHGKELAEIYANADVFVFPSKTDTFGVVMIEALSTGTPVAAYPVIGPIDIVKNGINGYLDENLAVAVEKALTCDRLSVEESSQEYDWEKCTETFLRNLKTFTKNENHVHCL